VTPGRGTRISTDEALARPPLPATATVPYGPSPRQTAELRLPETPGPHPVVVVVHGGCWRSIADRRYMQGVAADLVRHGWATWNLEFRRADDAGGGWPGTFLDVAEGTDHLRAVAPGFGLDVGRVAALGHSSGGHLALWLAARRGSASGSLLSAPDPLPLRGAVSLAGIADLAHFQRLDERACHGGVELLLGAPPEEVPERLASADPGHLLPLGVPQLLVHGAEDADVPPAHAEAYRERALAAGDDVDLSLVAGAGHFEVVAPWWEGWPAVRGRILAFLTRVAATRTVT